MKPVFSAIIIIILFANCGKVDLSGLNTGKQYFVIDSNVYCKVNINNKTLTTYGISINGRSGSTLTDVSTATNASGLHTDLDVLCYGSVLNASLENPTEQCDIELFLTKPGNVLGLYRHDSTINKSSYVMDLTAGNTKYFFDESSIMFNVAAADSPYVRGTFTGNLVNGTAVNGTYNLIYHRH